MLFRLSLILGLSALPIHLVRFGFSVEVLRFVAAFAVTLLAIFFSDEIGDFTGFTSRGYIDEKTPGGVVRFIAFFLFLFTCFVFIQKKAR